MIFAVVGMLLGAWITKHLHSFSDPHTQQVVAECISSSYKSVSFQSFGIEYLDKFTCVMTVFFMETKKTPIGQLILGAVLLCAISGWFVVAIESFCTSSRYFARSFFLIVLISQCVGGYLAMTVFWLPSISLTVVSAPISDGAVKKVYWLFLPLLLSLLAMSFQPFSSNIHIFNVSTVIFLFFPLFIPLLWRLTSTSQLNGTQTLRSTYNQLCYLSALVWFYMVYNYAKNINFSFEAYQSDIRKLKNPSPNQLYPAYFLAYDALLIWTAILCYAFEKVGFFKSLIFIFEGIVFGPGYSIFSVAYNVRNVMKIKY